MRRFQKSLIWGLLLVFFLTIYLIINIPDIEDGEVILIDKIFSFILKIAPNLLILAIIFIITNIIINLSLQFISRHFSKKGKKEEDIYLILIVYKYVVWFLAVLISLSTIFKNIGSLLTSIGLIGFGVTFALQKPIMNIVGWLSIVTNAPYKLGDRIFVNNIKGDVFDIKVMYTYLREVNENESVTGKEIIIPNEFVLTYPIINFTKGSHYIWDGINVAVTYESDWKKALKIIEDAANSVVGDMMKKLAGEWGKTHRKFDSGTSIDEKPKIWISLADSWINIRVRILIDIRRKREINTKITRLILDGFKKEKNVNFAYPHMHIVQDK